MNSPRIHFLIVIVVTARNLSLSPFTYLCACACACHVVYSTGSLTKSTCYSMYCGPIQWVSVEILLSSRFNGDQVIAKLGCILFRLDNFPLNFSVRIVPWNGGNFSSEARFYRGHTLNCFHPACFCNFKKCINFYFTELVTGRFVSIPDSSLLWFDISKSVSTTLINVPRMKFSISQVMSEEILR